MRYRLIALCMLLFSVPAAHAQVSVYIRLPSVNIGINLPVYPELAPVPGYPVYYAPNLNSNFFFYDGLYWVYQRDNWYASSWYNGPWGLVAPEVVPLFVLRIPVGYYRNPPRYFYGWRRNAPPRWGVRWGHRWERHRRGWDRWDRRAALARAPLPVYQRQYSGHRYPRAERQRTLRDRHYRYRQREAVVTRLYSEQNVRRATPRQRNETRRPVQPTPQMAGVRSPRAPQAQREAPRAQGRAAQRQHNDQPRRGRNLEQQNRRDRGAGRGQDRGR